MDKITKNCNSSFYTVYNNFQIGMRLCSLTKIFTFSRWIHKMFRGTRTPASPQKKKRWLLVSDIVCVKVGNNSREAQEVVS
jgi:hypothetical protein